MNRISTKTNTLEDIKDSVLLYETTLPMFGYIIITLCCLFLGLLLHWSIYATKPYVCRGPGTIQSDNKNYIMASYSGEIAEFYVDEGSYVNSGDLIASVHAADITLQQEQIEGQIAICKSQITKYETLIRSIRDDSNYFSEDNPDERTYFYQFENYKSQIAQNTLDVNAYKGYGYTDTQIQILIDQNQGKIDQIYYTTLQEIANKISELESNIENYEKQLEALGNGADSYSVYASASGIVHMDNAYKKGMVVSAGSVIGSIASENDEYEVVAYIALNDRPLIHEGDSCTIAVSGLNQSVYGTLKGEVVQIESDVTNVSGNNGSSNSAFKIHVKPENNYLVSKSGKQVSLSNGMSVETRVIYDEVTYFDYMLEALGVLTR